MRLWISIFSADFDSVCLNYQTDYQLVDKVDHDCLSNVLHMFTRQPQPLWCNRQTGYWLSTNTCISQHFERRGLVNFQQLKLHVLLDSVFKIHVPGIRKNCLIYNLLVSWRCFEVQIPTKYGVIAFQLSNQFWFMKKIHNFALFPVKQRLVLRLSVQ